MLWKCALQAHFSLDPTFLFLLRHLPPWRQQLWWSQIKWSLRTGTTPDLLAVENCYVQMRQQKGYRWSQPLNDARNTSWWRFDSNLLPPKLRNERLRLSYAFCWCLLSSAAQQAQAVTVQYFWRAAGTNPKYCFSKTQNTRRNAFQGPSAVSCNLCSL